MQERNDLGLQLIERNEEVCVFYEKLNLQESIIKKANLKLLTQDEELKFIRSEVGSSPSSPLPLPSPDIYNVGGKKRRKVKPHIISRKAWVRG